MGRQKMAAEIANVRVRFGTDVAPVHVIAFASAVAADRKFVETTAPARAIGRSQRRRFHRRVHQRRERVLFDLRDVVVDYFCLGQRRWFRRRVSSFGGQFRFALLVRFKNLVVAIGRCWRAGDHVFVVAGSQVRILGLLALVQRLIFHICKEESTNPYSHLARHLLAYTPSSSTRFLQLEVVLGS
ncbi:unnamed protein product, partial [Nesidiocoris tenuis]